jgi:L-2-hydroxyglutarate oxidase LhgO
MKFKEFKIDLGGSYPAKSEAVRRHAKTLGYPVNIDPSVFDRPFIRLNNLNSLSWEKSQECLWMQERAELISVENFLELTKEDVTEKEPELFYRYRIWSKGGNIAELSEFYKIENGVFVTAGGVEHYYEREVIKYERIGEGVTKCAGQK